MTVKAQNHKPGDMMDYTEPGSAAVTGGTPTQITDAIVGIPPSDIAKSGSDSLQIGGIIKIEATTSKGNAGDNVWYDSNGSPYGGTASSGAATTDASVGDFWIGTLAKDKSATDTHAYVFLNKENLRLPSWQNWTHELQTATKTLDAQDVNKVQHDLTDNAVITLPATVAGLKYRIQNDADDGGAKLSISPNANDKIMGADLAGVDNKDLINTKATQIRGDFVELTGDGADGWFVTDMRGIWAAE